MVTRVCFIIFLFVTGSVMGQEISGVSGAVESGILSLTWTDDSATEWYVQATINGTSAYSILATAASVDIPVAAGIVDIKITSSSGPIAQTTVDNPPAVPTGLIAAAGDASVTLGWDANVEPDFASYTVYKGIETGVLYEFQADLVSAYLTDNTATNDSTYYYAVSAVDDLGHESEQSSEVNATPEPEPLSFSAYSTATPTIADTTSTGTAEVAVTATLNRAAYIRSLARRYDSAYPDTTGMAWEQPAATSWSGDYDTGVDIATASSDSSVRVTWTASIGQDGYILQAYPTSVGAWSTVSGSIDADSTGYTWTAAPRDEINFRLYGYADGYTSAVAVIDTLVYNSAVRVYTQFHAVEDTSDYSSVLSSSEQSELWITPWEQ